MIVIDVDVEAWRIACAAGLYELDRRIAASERKLTTASKARQALPLGSSRARVTSANARHMRAAESHDRNLRARRALLGAKEAA